MDDWRIQRQLSYNIYCSWVKDPCSVFDYCSLPYDDEIMKMDKQEADQAWYNWASKEIANFNWNKN